MYIAEARPTASAVVHTVRYVPMGDALCGKPAVSVFGGDDGKRYAECVEHCPPSMRPVAS
jgi:hypothetical protein